MTKKIDDSQQNSSIEIEKNLLPPAKCIVDGAPYSEEHMLLALGDPEERERRKNKFLVFEKLTKIGCMPFKIKDHDDYDIFGIKPVRRNVTEVIDANGFTPYEKKTEEILSKPFAILFSSDMQDDDYRKTKTKYKKKGIEYIVSNDPNIIINHVMNLK